MSSVGNKKVENYINEVCNLVKNKRVHEDIKDELVSHIEEITEDYINCGMCEDEAYDKALLQMGSSNVVGRDLNKVHKAMADWILITFTGAFILFGLFTLSSVLSSYSSDSVYRDLVLKSVIFAICGILLFIFVLRIDCRNIKKYSKYIYGITVFIMIVAPYIRFLSNYVNGLVKIGSVTFNLYDIAPFFLIIALAGIFDTWDWNSKKSMLLGFSISIVPGMCLFIGKSLSNIIIYVVAATTILILSGLKMKRAIGLFSIVGALSAIYLYSSEYIMRRFLSFIYTSRYPDYEWWIYNQLNKIREAAGLFGSGAEFNEAVLPSAHTDFVFSYIIYSFGIIVGIILVASILVFIIRIGFIGATTKDNYGKLLVSGLCSLYGIQFLLSILITFNLMPVVAVSMPFISYSGSQLFINILGVGIISNVYKWRNTKLIAA